MEAELKALSDKEVWEVVDAADVLEGKKVMDCMWVFVNKFDADRNIVKRKA